MPIATSGGALVTGANIVDGSIGPVDLNDDAVANKFPASLGEYLKPVYETTTSKDNIGHSSNTTMLVGLMVLNAKITVSQISTYIRTVHTSGKIKIAIFSGDGLTKHIEVESATISAGGILNIACTPTRLLPGTYYVAILPVSTTNLETWGPALNTDAIIEDVNNNISGKAKTLGSITVTASTIPSTIDPTAITGIWGTRIPFLRLSA